MTAERWFALDGSGRVVNVMLWDGISALGLPDGVVTMRVPAGSTAGIGWAYADGAWVAPPPPPPATTPDPTDPTDPLLGSMALLVGLLADVQTLGDVQEAGNAAAEAMGATSGEA